MMNVMEIMPSTEQGTNFDHTILIIHNCACHATLTKHQAITIHLVGVKWEILRPEIRSLNLEEVGVCRIY